MPAQTTWASETPAVNRTASFEIRDAKSRDSLDSNELCGSGLPSIHEGSYAAFLARQRSGTTERH
jgi:hypothetical protein